MFGHSVPPGGQFMYQTKLLFLLPIDNVEDKNPASKCGNTPLHAAVIIGNLEITNLIIKSSGDWNPKNNQGKTPLSLAAERNHFDIISLIIERRKCSNRKEGILSRFFRIFRSKYNFFELCKVIMENIPFQCKALGKKRKHPGDN